MTDFGRTIYCADSLQTGRYVSGTRLIAQALYRRLITPRGTLRGGEAEGSYGTDLLGVIGGVNVSPAQVKHAVESECRKDPRVSSAIASVSSEETAPGQFTYTVVVDCVTAAGPFELVVGVDDVTVRLLGVA